MDILYDSVSNIDLQEVNLQVGVLFIILSLIVTIIPLRSDCSWRICWDSPTENVTLLLLVCICVV